ncbi:MULTISPECIES: GNAT family N-acetyltransferase [unclassified Coleofasciculus]|uniref:GNAT family N-acetyltransferase n=1 Tax=unclassified Coleofasciculus TaxID=2692782 RepID=UPI001880CA3D|nr:MULTISPECIES: GNAT family N-acetyltransferase [unclassified Coleofasciculus]MBE9130158.1 GNAT family N-acetyltransferase [Coleofasciculus sp. LEGE 07081]MBE9152495.1 GNAT family N-acetyltransferase [Coleofasciculus sp. LEGE 07092]
MTSPLPENAKSVIRPIQYRDLEAIEQLTTQVTDVDSNSCSLSLIRKLQQVRRWYGLLMFLSWFPNPCQYDFCVYVSEAMQRIYGLIKVSPFNRTRSTWRVERVLVASDAPTQRNASAKLEIGSGLLRHCFETIWEARTWLLEVNIHHKTTVALYRQNGFQPLAQLTYWAIAPQQLENLADHEPDLPNLLPVSNADAQLLYQLDTASMPPLVRQVFDRHIQDFKVDVLSALLSNLKQWFSQTEAVSAYVFEPQRKAAIGYFRLKLSRDGSCAHEAQLTVHPAYTCLYPELLAQMARIVRECPEQSLQLASADYQPEREEYLEQLGAQRIEHTLLMSRSVWHKLREARPLEALQLSEVLQGLQPSRTPIPSRISWWESLSKKPHAASKPSNTVPKDATPSTESPEMPD